jgi:hypothetical protein
MADEADNSLSIWPKDWRLGTLNSLVSGEKKGIGNWALYASGMVRMYLILFHFVCKLNYVVAS